MSTATKIKIMHDKTWVSYALVASNIKEQATRFGLVLLVAKIREEKLIGTLHA
jgi:hypothetical protein